MQNLKLLLVTSLVLATSATAQDNLGEAAASGNQSNGSDGVISLPRATFIQQMDAEFSRLDTDGNGIIFEEEVIATQRQAAQAEALRQNQAAFVRLDKDGDGVLSLSEFAVLANPDAIPVSAKPLMNQFDTDKDGVITLVEYRIATQANFDRVDVDRDGVVSSKEMRAAGFTP